MTPQNKPGLVLPAFCCTDQAGGVCTFIGFFAWQNMLKDFSRFLLTMLNWYDLIMHMTKRKTKKAPRRTIILGTDLEPWVQRHLPKHNGNFSALIRSTIHKVMELP